MLTEPWVLLFHSRRHDHGSFSDESPRLGPSGRGLSLPTAGPPCGYREVPRELIRREARWQLGGRRGRVSFLSPLHTTRGLCLVQRKWQGPVAIACACPVDAPLGELSPGQGAFLPLLGPIRSRRGVLCLGWVSEQVAVSFPGPGHLVVSHPELWPLPPQL